MGSNRLIYQGAKKRRDTIEGHTSEPLKPIEKILETRPKSTIKNQKSIKKKICKIYDVDKSSLVFGFQ